MLAADTAFNINTSGSVGLNGPSTFSNALAKVALLVDSK